MKREELKSMFDALRNDPQHHLGLGDIRLTIAQQDEILAMVPPLPPAEGAEEMIVDDFTKSCGPITWDDLVKGNAGYTVERTAELMRKFAAQRQPHPTAEGAEKRTDLRLQFERESESFWSVSAIPTIGYVRWLENKVLAMKDPIQPTAEGAEEIDELIKKHIMINAANFEFCVRNNIINGFLLQGIREVATLHAQQIAEKMVSERWINVEDRLPEKDGKSSIYCLVNSEYDGIVVRPYNEYHKCWDDEDADDYYCDAIGGKITHWMPLPNPPIR